MGDFSHLKEDQATMVDVGDKKPSQRIAASRASVRTGKFNIKKELSTKAQNELISVIRIAGICAAKKTSELIPLCHPLSLSQVDCSVELKENEIVMECTAKTVGITGVEMEAMTGAAIAALTCYDMIKSQCPEATIENIFLLSKEGGKSGVWKRKSPLTSL